MRDKDHGEGGTPSLDGHAVPFSPDAPTPSVGAGELPFIAGEQTPNPDSSARPPVAALWTGSLRALGSLWLAIVLIVVYTAALIAGTVIEKISGAETARSYIYGADWFAALHVVLGVNILCSLLVRFPWRWRQAGFVVTHVGILVLLAGCLVSQLGGIRAELPVVEGRYAHIAEQESGDTVDLGFQVYLHKFRRKLDPGSRMPSHYSSLVDLVDRDDPGKKLRENVLVTLNAPVDFTDPRTGRKYRLFQSSFDGPWTPGDSTFDKLAAGDRSRDHLYRTQLSVNYDPGRGLKCAGCAMIVVGIALVYGRLASGLARRGQIRSAINVTAAIVVLLSTVGTVSAAEHEKLDWTTWQHLPALGEGRVAPADTLARETVEAICGRAEPTLRMPDGQWRRFTAAELLFAWLAEPQRWEEIPFLPAEDEELRKDVLRLPVNGEQGRRVRCVSPKQIDQSDGLQQYFDDFRRRAVKQGNDFRPTGIDKNVNRLFDAYDKYRALTFDAQAARSLPPRFRPRLLQVRDSLLRVGQDSEGARRISGDQETSRLLVQTMESYQKLIARMHEEQFSVRAMEPLVASLRQSGDKLASRMATGGDRILVGLAADLRRQLADLHLSLYDSGEGLRLVPTLNAGALEENRTPDDDASPWIGFPTMISGSDEVLAEYPQTELRAVRQAFADAKAAYRDHSAAERSTKFGAAMDRFAQSLRALGEKIEPLRQKLPILDRDQSLIDATAYPPPGSTDAEVLYNRLDPFFWSWTVSTAAMVCLLLAVGRWQEPLFWLGLVVLAVAQGFTVAGLGLRAYITGLAPLTGMFESVVVVGLFVGILGLGFTLAPLLASPLSLWERVSVRAARQKSQPSSAQPSPPAPLPEEEGRIDRVLERRLFALAGAIVGSLAVALANYAPASVMHRHIGSALPILRDNFWLVVHVVTIMAGYAAGAIALILANISLGYYLFGRYTVKESTTNAPAPVGRRPPAVCQRLAGFIYTAIKITVLLLAAGTILGALWADKAWGRFWGWDSKEVWALVSLMIYLVLLHARYVGRSGSFMMNVTGVLGAMAILFTWYGVSFILGTGMHAYGSGAGGEWPVLGAMALQMLFLIAAACRCLIETAATPSGDAATG